MVYPIQQNKEIEFIHFKDQRQKFYLLQTIVGVLSDKEKGLASIVPLDQTLGRHIDRKNKNKSVD